jgi:ketol-acid reductoisomerase
MANYFNTLNLRQQLAQLGKCRFMARDEFADGASYLQGKKVVIVGCGAQGLNQGLNMRDSVSATSCVWVKSCGPTVKALSKPALR